MKDHEADDDRLDEKEDGVELVVTLIAYDCSGHEAGEVKNAADGVFRCDCAIPGADDLPGCTRALRQARELQMGSRNPETLRSLHVRSNSAASPRVTSSSGVTQPTSSRPDYNSRPALDSSPHPVKCSARSQRRLTAAPQQQAKLFSSCRFVIRFSRWSFHVSKVVTILSGCDF